MAFSAVVPALFGATGAAAAVHGAAPASLAAAAALAQPGQVTGVGGAPALGGPGASAHGPVGLAPTATGRGYWVAAADGGVFSYGDARFYGSAGSIHLNQPIVGIAATPTGRGYWLAAADGGIFTYGDAAFGGSLVASHPALPVSTIVAAPGGGYWLGDRDGSLHAFGGAAPVTGVGASSAAPMVAVGAGGGGLWELAGDPPPAPAPPVVNAAAGRPLGIFSVTCYDLGGTTASGAPVGMNVVATDPSVIPLGSHIWIDGVGERTALDTGGAIVGNRLDIWMPTYSACVTWGRQARAVTLLSA